MANKKTQENTSKYWWLKHLVLALIAALATVLILFWMLKGITRHGKTLEVPDLTNMTLSEARKVAKKNHIRIKITDSVYIPQLHAGQVLKQTPGAGSRVKKNRNILITINSLVPMMVKAPDVVGYSLRQAESNLHAEGSDTGNGDSGTKRGGPYAWPECIRLLDKSPEPSYPAIPQGKRRTYIQLPESG